MLEQASVINDEVAATTRLMGEGWSAPARSAILFWRISHSDRSAAPLSTLLSLLEQASVRNDEVTATTRLMGGGWRAPARSAIHFWRSSPSERSVAPLSNLLSLVEQASVRNDEVAATSRMAV